MLVKCNQGCKNDVTTNALLDPETDEAVCDYCGDVLNHISPYAKKAMKSNGDILRKRKANSFTFPCTFCKKDMKAVSHDGKIKGEGCGQKDCCNFEITDYMKRAVELYSKDNSDENMEK